MNTIPKEMADLRAREVILGKSCRVEISVDHYLIPESAKYHEQKLMDDIEPPVVRDDDHWTCEHTPCYSDPVVGEIVDDHCRTERMAHEE